ncbi:ABC transporter [Streptococcus macacae NCTC 11558]|uniref:Type II secretion system F domain protein n=1 Tax=Streptococcus macacae NCTC 11558 TaxID=764298 RepID=G5JWA8_9STRE|nr:type II secretion system F domain protein [Streptococcus macacae NCTC 11558]SUN77763.1 ABC transporter [Streptococcus macacae NCTC 11558]
MIQLLNNLFTSGFNLPEIINFLDRSRLLSKIYIKEMRRGLLSGMGLAEIMSSLGFSDDVVTQLALSEIHGNTQKSLLKIESYLENVMAVKKKLVEVATYPIILLVFLVLIMLGLKNYLFPQLEKGNAATQVITQFPTFFLLSVVIIMFLLSSLYLLSRKVKKIKLMAFYARLPFIGNYFQLYLTAYYAREWGNLIGQGVEMSHIVKLMQSQKSQLFKEIGADMEQALLSGQGFHQKVLDYPFFLKELSLMIEYGEVKSKLGSELDIYAEETWESFFSKIQRVTQLIQPLVFILVAFVIVMIYAAMLLPIYQNMEVHL